MKKLLLIVTLALMVTSLRAETIKHGVVTDKAIDPPRYVHYPYVGKQDINKKPIYWLEIDRKWHRVTSDEYAQYRKGQFFSRKTNVDFYPVF
jgi:hypothetical protein